MPPTRLTPYDRSPNNWLSKIADGAGRVMRSVLYTDSSSSSFGPEATSSSDDGEVNMDGSAPDVSGSIDGNQKNENLNEATQGLYPGLMQWTSETKRAIVLLLMQETFSKEECECLIDIINSRSVDNSNPVSFQEKRPYLAIGSDAHSTDVCCKTVMEARKWMNERKIRSDSLSESPSSVTSCNYNRGSSPYNTRKFGSPVEIARTYMNSRPPSSMESLAAYKTPQSRRMQSLWEGSPGPIRGKSLLFTEDLAAVVAQDDAKSSPSKITEPPQKADVLKGATHVILTRRSLAVELDSQADSILSGQKLQNSVRGSHEGVATSNNNEVGLCKFASESLVEIPSNDICL